MNVVEILRAAREMPWCQNTFRREDGACCPLAAMSDGGSAAGRAAVEFLRIAADCKYILKWNDSPGRTHDEVLAAYDRAIALAEQKAAS